MGAAGDMLTAALLELLPDPDAFIKKLNELGIPGVTVRKESTVKCGIQGTHFSVLVNNTEEDEHIHDHPLDSKKILSQHPLPLHPMSMGSANNQNGIH